jgi:hypothetical protein
LKEDFEGMDSAKPENERLINYKNIFKGKGDRK